MKATGTRLGLLVNFGAARLEFKRFVLGYDSADYPASSLRGLPVGSSFTSDIKIGKNSPALE
jgi:hypothetical protein